MMVVSGRGRPRVNLEFPNLVAAPNQASESAVCEERDEEYCRGDPRKRSHYAGPLLKVSLLVFKSLLVLVGLGKVVLLRLGRLGDVGCGSNLTNV